jgi:hypothetical protein
MQIFRSKRNFWLSVGIILILSLVLALLDGSQAWYLGWLSYAILLALGVGSLAWLGNYVSADKRVRNIALLAFALRLGIGVALTLLLPVVGYPDNEVHQAGYIFHDANIRDQQAWELASSEDPISSAFKENYSGDQYGGTLALSASIYRYISPDAHRPFLTLILTATAAAWGTMLLWRATHAWFGESIAWITAMIFALYPESVLLGSSQMRESFVITGVAMTFFALTKMRREKLSWLAWLIAAGVILFAIQPPVALYAVLILFGLWLLDPGQRKSGKSWRSVALFALFAGVLFVAMILVVSLWTDLPSLQRAGPVGVFFTWLQNNFQFQSYQAERASGMLQMLLDTAGDQWKWLIVFVYGVAQPVLPAVVGDPDAAWIMRVIGFFRAAGWYALAPFLVYAVIAVFRASGQERRSQLLWLNFIIWVWIIISALTAGGDQWDNPRYRTILLAWEALVAAWAWWWARKKEDVWLRRVLILVLIFVLMFTEWYLGRYYPIFPHLSIWMMIAITLSLSALVLVGGWFNDRRKGGDNEA